MAMHNLSRGFPRLEVLLLAKDDKIQRWIMVLSFTALRFFFFFFSAKRNIKKPHLFSRYYIPLSFDVCKGLLFSEQFYFKDYHSYLYIDIDT